MSPWRTYERLLLHWLVGSVRGTIASIFCSGRDLDVNSTCSRASIRNITLVNLQINARVPHVSSLQRKTLRMCRANFFSLTVKYQLRVWKGKRERRFYANTHLDCVFGLFKPELLRATQQCSELVYPLPNTNSNVLFQPSPIKLMHKTRIYGTPLTRVQTAIMVPPLSRSMLNISSEVFLREEAGMSVPRLFSDPMFRRPHHPKRELKLTSWPFHGLGMLSRQQFFGRHNDCSRNVFESVQPFLPKINGVFSFFRWPLKLANNTHIGTVLDFRIWTKLGWSIWSRRMTICEAGLKSVQRFRLQFVTRVSHVEEKKTRENLSEIAFFGGMCWTVSNIKSALEERSVTFCTCSLKTIEILWQTAANVRINPCSHVTGGELRWV